MGTRTCNWKGVFPRPTVRGLVPPYCCGARSGPPAPRYSGGGFRKAKGKDRMRSSQGHDNPAPQNLASSMLNGKTNCQRSRHKFRKKIEEEMGLTKRTKEKTTENKTTGDR